VHACSESIAMQQAKEHELYTLAVVNNILWMSGPNECFLDRLACLLACPQCV
jgi:hypothetical protein